MLWLNQLQPRPRNTPAAAWCVCSLRRLRREAERHFFTSDSIREPLVGTPPKPTAYVWWEKITEIWFWEGWCGESPAACESKASSRRSTRTDEDNDLPRSVGGRLRLGGRSFLARWCYDFMRKLMLRCLCVENDTVTPIWVHRDTQSETFKWQHRTLIQSFDTKSEVYIFSSLTDYGIFVWPAAQYKLVTRNSKQVWILEFLLRIFKMPNEKGYIHVSFATMKATSGTFISILSCSRSE